MSKVLKVISEVAAVVAVAAEIASFLIPGGQIFGVAFGTIAAIAGSVSAVAGAAAQALQKPPDAKGSVSETLIGANMPVPYAIGRTYSGGCQVFDDSAGTKNSDRTQIFVGTHAGPIEGFETALLDFADAGIPLSGARLSGASTGYYSGFLWCDSRLGTRPDTALAAILGRPAFSGWDSSSKLSGQACWYLDMKFDTKGERWSSGIPARGVVAKWVLAYDPRLDSTYPGGSGAQRWDDESTWTWTENPGLHALTYARGRFMGANDVKVVGVGLAKTSIDIPAFVEFANVCDANGWKAGGTIYEGPGISKWNNLKSILDAGAAKPCWVGGVLTLSISAPKTALDTITKDDLIEGDIAIPAMKAWKDRFNTIVPRYRSEANRWEYVQASQVSNSTYIAEDGETKTDERQYDLIQDVNQAAQRAAYDLVNEREYGPIQLPLKPRLRPYRPGEALNVDLGSICDDTGLGVQLAVISGRTVDPQSGAVTLELVSETSAKHPFALGQTGTAPPTPTIPAAGAADQIVSQPTTTTLQTALRNTFAGGGFTITADPVGTGATIHLHGPGPTDPFVIDYPGQDDATIAAFDITGLAQATTYFPFADAVAIGDPAPTFGVTTVYADALNSSTNPNRFFLGRSVTTPSTGGGTVTGGGTGGGYTGSGFTGDGGHTEYP